MISAFFNIRKIPDLRNRVIFSLLMVVLYRVGCSLTVPGVNASVLGRYFEDQVNSASSGGVAQLFNIFSGGALEHCAIFSLGVMPYISASIMVQLLTAVLPQLGKLAKEEGGRQKISQYTRYITIVLCIFQGWLLANSFQNPGTLLPGIEKTMSVYGPLVPLGGYSFIAIAVISLTAGAVLLMWIGDQVTERGIGNGMSLIISVGIVAQLPAALVQAWRTFVPSGASNLGEASPVKLVMMIGFLVLVIGGVICITQAQRRIAVQYAKRVVGRKVMGGVSQYMPLKVNYAGVMPIIFAQAILVFPGFLIKTIWPTSTTAAQVADGLAHGGVHYIVTALMIFFFSYFWVATQFQPQQISDDLKRAGGYIPGVRPGKATADFLDNSMTRLTFAGAIFLTLIALLPQMLAERARIPYIAAQFFGGTSILIVVGVVLDTMKQIETHLLQRNYDGFLRKGKLRGRFDRNPEVLAEASSNAVVVWIALAAACIILAGVVAFLVRA
jgi:preprotein translocase subunit SecY